MKDKTLANLSFLAGLALSLKESPANIRKGSVNQNKNIELVRVERRRAGFKPQHMMRAMSRGAIHNPNKVIGAYITIASSDPQLLKGREAREFVIAEGRKIGLVGKLPMLTAHVHPSRRKLKMWETRWELI